MAMDNEFNPGFSFDFGDAAAAEAPWEFGSALKQAVKEQRNSNATSIDQKIKKHLNTKAAALKAANGKAGRRGPARDSSDSDAGSSSDEDDAPLPGELDESDGEDAELAADESSEEEGGMDMSDDEEGSEGAEEEDSSDDEEEAGKKVVSNGVGNKQGKAVANGGSTPAAAAAKARAALALKQAQRQQEQPEEEGSESGSEEESEEGDGGSEAAGSEDGSEGDEEEEEEEEVDEEESEGEEEEEEVEERSARKRQKAGAGPSGRSGDGGDGGRFFAETPEGTRFQAGSFGDLKLSRPLLKAVASLGFTQPTPIQAACIPLALSGRDICGSAITGSGKTAAYALPILERLLYRPRQVAATYVVILTPTRELAVQVHSMVEKLGQFTDVTVALIVGGLSLQVQAATLRKGPEIVVATPGRLIDHLRNTQSVGLEDLSVLVLDEADRLLQMGFKDEVAEVVRMAPRKRQTMLFSATFNDEVKQLVALSLRQPVRLAADPTLTAPKLLAQEIIRLKGAEAARKEAYLMALCARSFRDGRTIVFFKTKQRAHRMKILFGLTDMPPAGELHGDMTQAARLESLERFRRGELAFLLCTDVAARGLDIIGVQYVVNYDAPRTLETYLHRIGRTARAGATGLAVTIADDDDRALLKEVVKRTKANLKARIIASVAVQQWQARIEALAGDIAEVVQEERDERAIRKAEMEAAKGVNMVEHEEEIYARPARTWFQTERQKREVVKAARDNENTAAEDPKKSKAAKQDRKRQDKARRAAEVEATSGGKRRRSELQEETEGHTRAIKASKSRARAIAQERGLPMSKAARIAAAEARGPAKKKRKTGKDKAGGPQLFSGDGTGRGLPPGSTSGPVGSGSGGAGGGGGSGKGAGAGKAGPRDRSKLSKMDLNKVRRGGKGKHAFKSKSRHRRK